jgi:hypothetical protein
MAHEVAHLCTLEILLGGLAFLVAHEEEQPKGDAGEGDNTDNNAGCDTSDVGAGFAVGLGFRGRLGSFGLLLA